MILGMSYLTSMSLSVLICKILRLIPNGILVHTCNTEDGAWHMMDASEVHVNFRAFPLCELCRAEGYSPRAFV